jgi:DedD protein
MARSISEQELQLKKRARRRLVGAIVLVTAVAVVLPMVLDSEPKPVRQNVDIHIPSPESGEFKSKPSGASQQAPAAIKGLPEAKPDAAPPEAAAAPAGAPSAQSATPPSVETPLKSDTSVSRPLGAGERAPTSPPKDRADSGKAPAPAARAEAPAAARPSSSDRPESTRPASKAPSPKPETSSARAGSSVPPSKSEGSPSRSSSANERTDSARSAAVSQPEASAARADNARNTSASPKRTDADADSGSYFVQVAALSDAVKARRLQKQISGVGVKTYTEVVATKTGEVTRVRAGPYATREAAEKARAQLKKAGLDGQVVAK